MLVKLCRGSDRGNDPGNDPSNAVGGGGACVGTDVEYLVGKDP